MECEGFMFTSEFDSGNIARVELVPQVENVPTNSRFEKSSSHHEDVPDYEFNIWTKHDCSETEYENSNRTWFYFGISGGSPCALVKLNIVNLNKQSRLYSQGMAPVFRVLPGRSHWERIKEKTAFIVDDKNFTMSFTYRTLENPNATFYFAFTYPFTYMDLQKMLNNIDTEFKKKKEILNTKAPQLDDIYYHRECVCYTTEDLRVDLITISSHHGINKERESRLRHLFPDKNVPRAYSFSGKKVIFVSARVHPGETPSSFVLNGFLHCLLSNDDPVAILIRKTYVFKLIPMLNPDGVQKGHYRTDLRGVNLNRVYLKPSIHVHPSVYAARALIRFYHHGQEVEDENIFEADHCLQDSDGDDCDMVNDGSEISVNESVYYLAEEIDDTIFSVNKVTNIESQVSDLTLNERNESQKNDSTVKDSNKCDVIAFAGNSNGLPSEQSTQEPVQDSTESIFNATKLTKLDPVKVKGLSIPTLNGKERKIASAIGYGTVTEKIDSGLFLYVDLHAHASKKGIFMFGNYFDNVEDSVECMLLPKIMSINSQNFHFNSCNFSERNMYLRDRRDGMSREGSGRVAVHKATGLIKSYTLECNYNTGRYVNPLPPCARDYGRRMPAIVVPPKYTPAVFEEIGYALGASILDLSGTNPYSRIPNSEFHTLSGIKDWLRTNCVPDNVRRQQAKQCHRFQSSSSQVAGTSSSSSGKMRVRQQASRGLEHKPFIRAGKKDVLNILPAPQISNPMNHDFKDKTGTILPSMKVKNTTCQGDSILKQVLAVRTKVSVVGALASSSKSKVGMKGCQSQRIPSLGSGGGPKKIVNGGNRLTKFRKSSLVAKSRDISLALCAFPEAFKGNLLVERTKGDQVIPTGTKRLRAAPLKLDQASCSGTYTRETGRSAALENAFVVLRNNENSEEVEAETPNNKLTAWSANQEPLAGCSTSVAKGKIGQRKVIGQSIPLIRTSRLESRCTSSSNKYCVKLDKQVKTRVLHLNPVKGLHKSPSFIKKKNSELVKKRGKVSLKNIVTAVSKFRVAAVDQPKLQQLTRSARK